MRVLQFWILVLGSTLVSALMIKQIFLTRDLDQEQRLFVDSQETAATEPGYENAWHKVAIHIYLASRQDPALAQVLKDNGIQVRQGEPAKPEAPAKKPETLLQPGTP